MKIKKKLFSVVLAMVLVFSLLPAAAVNANEPVSVTIDGQLVQFVGQGPVIIDGNTLVPVRGVFEVLGFTADWDGVAQQATLISANYVVVLTIGSNTFTTNGVSQTLEVPAQLIGGSTMLPLRAVIESVGHSVAWDGQTWTVLITTAAPPPPNEEPELPTDYDEEAYQEEVYPTEEEPGLSAYDLFNIANEALLAAGSLIMTTESNIAMVVEFEGVVIEEIEMIMSSVIEMVIRSETDMDMRTVMTTAIGDESFPATSYFRDGTIYMELEGEWISMPMPIEDIIAMTGVMDLVPAEGILVQTIVETAEGVLLNFTISGQAMTDMVNSLLGAFGDLGLEELGVEMYIGDVVVSSLVDADGMFVFTDMEMYITMEIEGVVMAMYMTSRSVITQIGGVTIEFPDFLDEI